MILNKIPCFVFFAFFTLIVSAQTEKEELDQLMHIWAERDFAEEVSIVSDFLKSKGYKIPSEKSFKQRSLDYFGIDVDSITFDCQYMISKYDYSCFTKNGRFLLTYTESFLMSEYKGFDVPLTPKQGLELLNSPNNEYSPHLIAYNKLLFNDNTDTFVKNYFLSNRKNSLQEVVIYFNYEKNSLLYEVSLPVWDDDLRNMWHFIFYNNSQKGYRKRLLNDLYIQSGEHVISILLKDLSDNWYIYPTGIPISENKKITITSASQDKALLHLIKLQSQHQSEEASLTDSQRKAYQYLINFYEIDNKLESRLKENNFYNMGLKVSAEEQKVISESKNTLIENHYITKSNDNYINFRSQPNSKAPIINKLLNDIDLIKINVQGEWLYVKLKDSPSIKGYVHLSQLEYNDNN
ncbi:hypothetical protein A9G45_01555 [Gilliamella sp. HK2]|jgi:hypothetical protein|uniref:SH3 domain-containing protein n=1 Tax=unclassified Gilliamella TaxID=2685620 RepID=UPI00080E570D|nr:SH3 domain-containing protein [Gilliamella apicola]OCG26144.1 hypothetical protein A9G46_00135 [Gilliamella apicola]OCG31222.1 hypothetical protein A9G45_01555 [Gilliamella apicola]